MLDKVPTPGGLVLFHTVYKLTLMAHSPNHFTEMGRLVADAGSGTGMNSPSSRGPGSWKACRSWAPEASMSTCSST
jgi:hypothetical protein